MRLNGHYVDAITKWNTSFKTDIKENIDIQSVNNKPKVIDLEHKLDFIVVDDNTAMALEEMFENETYNIAVIEGTDDYDGIYTLGKGSIAQARGHTFWKGKLWLENKTDQVRYAHRKEDFDNDFEILQVETSLDTELINGIAVVGTWALVSPSSTTIGCSSDAGANTYTIGYDWWNTVIFEADITLNGTTEFVGLCINHIDNSNFYVFRILNNASLDFTKQVATVFTTLYNETKVFTNGSTYNLKVVYSNGRFDLYLDNEFKVTIYDYDILSSKCGFYDLKATGNYFTNVKVTQYIPPSIQFPSGFDEYTHPHPQDYVGSLQALTNFEEEPETKTYPSRILNDEVRVWDTQDNDFSQTFVPPMPLKWQRVYSIKHEFIGNMYVEIGLYGILYAKSGLFHYVYDKKYRKGSIIDIDFKQNPQYDVWNEPYSHRQFNSENQGQGNWDEDGLNFEEVVSKQSVPTTGTVDMVVSDDRIPQLQGTIFDQTLMDIEVEFEFTPDTSSYDDNGYSRFVPIYVNSLATDNEIMVYYDNSLERIYAHVSDLSIGSTINTDTNSFPNGETHKVKIVKTATQDSWACYKNGILLPIAVDGVSGDYLYFSDAQGDVVIGGSEQNSLFNLNHYHGNISNMKMRLGNQGKTVTRSLAIPLVWHSLDEADWDNASADFVSKGSKDVELALSGTPKLRKDGRYNQCLELSDATNDLLIGDLFTDGELNGTTTFTAEIWLKFTDTPSTTHQILRVYDFISGDVVMGIELNTTNLRGYILLSAVPTEVLYANTSHTIDTDQKWHHIALTNDGSDLRLYIDGVIVGTTSHSVTPDPTPTRFDVGDGTFDGFVDEVMVSGYAKQPHEFGVIIPDVYETGQWYSNAEVETKDGKLRRKENPKVPIFEIDYINGFVDTISNETLTLSSVGDIGISPTKVGLGYDFGLDDGGNAYIKADNFNFSIDKTFRFQYTPLDLTTELYINRFFYGNSSESMYVKQFTDGTLRIFDGSSTTNGSSVLVVGTMYEIVVVLKTVSGTHTLDLYINGVKEFSNVSTASHLTGTELTGSFYIGSGVTTTQGKFGNISVFDGTLSTSEFGIVVDTENEIPTFYGEIKNRSNDGSTVTTESYNKYILKSISPEFVEVDIYETLINIPINSRIESGNYFIKLDKKNHPSNSFNVNGFLYLMSENNYRFWLGLSNENQTLYDMGIEGASFGTGNTDNIIYGFGNQLSNMMMGVYTSKIGSYSNQFFVSIADDGQELSDELIIDIDDGIALIGLVPQRSVNEMFWDATEGLKNGSATYVNDAGNWFLAMQQLTDSTECLTIENQSNYKKYPKGLYLMIARAKETAGVANARIWNSTLGSSVKDEGLTSASYHYTYVLGIITEDNTEDDIELLTLTGAGDIIVDYILIIPLTNGHNMPLDYIRKSLTKTFKEKLLVK